MFSFLKKKLGFGGGDSSAPAPAPVEPAAPPSLPASPPALPPAPIEPVQVQAPAPVQPVAPAAPAPQSPVVELSAPPPVPAVVEAVPAPVPAPAPEAAPRKSWLDKLRAGLRKTGSSIAQVFTGTQIDDALYEELEAALLMADAGVKATEFLLEDLKKRVLLI